MKSAAIGKQEEMFVAHVVTGIGRKSLRRDAQIKTNEEPSVITEEVAIPTVVPNSSEMTREVSNMRGLFWLLVAVGVVAVVLAFVFGVSIWAGLLLVGLVIVAPIAGGLVAVFVPGPMIIKAICGLSVSIIVLVFGMRYLGMV